jgi:catechol 2,3-dioxygenase-like lactoylglutathione lyase family enzyme
VKGNGEMVRVVGIDHLVIRVGDFETSKAFYAKLFDFLGFEVLDEYEDAIGWTNGKTRYWIGQADAEGRKHKHRIGDIGFHHYAFELRSRADVDTLQAFLEEQGAKIVDPAGEYYEDYYAVFFLDPDGLKLEGMKYGERHKQAARARAARRQTPGRKRRPRRASGGSPSAPSRSTGACQCDRNARGAYFPASRFPASRPPASRSPAGRSSASKSG